MKKARIFARILIFLILFLTIKRILEYQLEVSGYGFNEKSLWFWLFSFVSAYLIYFFTGTFKGLKRGVRYIICILAGVGFAAFVLHNYILFVIESVCIRFFNQYQYMLKENLMNPEFGFNYIMWFAVYVMFYMIFDFKVLQRMIKLFTRLIKKENINEG